MIDNIELNFPDREVISVTRFDSPDITVWLTPWEKASPRIAEFALYNHRFMSGYALVEVTALHTPEYIDQKCNHICGWAIGKRAEYERHFALAPTPVQIVQACMFDEVTP